MPVYYMNKKKAQRQYLNAIARVYDNIMNEETRKIIKDNFTIANAEEKPVAPVIESKTFDIVRPLHKVTDTNIDLFSIKHKTFDPDSMTFLANCSAIIDKVKSIKQGLCSPGLSFS